MFTNKNVSRKFCFKKYLLNIFLLNVIFQSSQTNSENILDLMGCPSPSHHIWHKALVNALGKNGHNLTVLSTDIDSAAPKNVNYIHMEGVYDFIYKEQNVDLISMADDTQFENLFGLYAFGEVACKGIIRSKGLQALIEYPNNFKFDLILYDFTLGPCILGFLHKFNYPPLIAVSPFNMPPYTVELMGGHNYKAYIPFFSTKYDTDMTLVQRINNILLYTVDSAYRNIYAIPYIDNLSKQIFTIDTPYGGDLEKYAVLALVNSHSSIDFPQPIPPNIIQVGGLQIADPKPLPKDMELFLNSSKKGSVLISLGTNIRSDQLGLEKLKIIIDTFVQLNDYNFVWKFESDELPILVTTKNILIKPFLPQNDILAHHNTKAFITHAGLLSTQEATWHGVPMIGIPFFVDQQRNLHQSIKAGIAEGVYLPTITVEELKSKLLMILEKPKYRKNISIRSRLFRDQPEHPLKRAVWWVEYILRNPNSTIHLESPVKVMGWFRANNIDIWLIFLFLIVGFILCSHKLYTKYRNVLIIGNKVKCT